MKMEDAELRKAFASIESHDIHVSAIEIHGSPRQQMKTLRSLKNWNKRTKS